jgi:hypothetical protein
MPKNSNKRKILEERELSNAERGKKIARPVKDIRREKGRPKLRLVAATEFVSKISASRLEERAAAPEEEDLFPESEEPVQSLGEERAI